MNELGEGRDLYLLNAGSGEEGGGGVKRKRSGVDQSLQMQAALMAAQIPPENPITVGVPRYSQPQQMPMQSAQHQQSRVHEAPRFPPSPHSDESPVPSPQQWMMQPIVPQEQVLVNNDRTFNTEMAHDQQEAVSNGVSTRNDALDAAGVNEAAEKLDSLDISIPSGMVSV